MIDWTYPNSIRYVARGRILEFVIILKILEVMDHPMGRKRTSIYMSLFVVTNVIIQPQMIITLFSTLA